MKERHREDDTGYEHKQEDYIEKIDSNLPTEAVFILSVISLIFLQLQLPVVGQGPVEDDDCKEKTDYLGDEVVEASAIKKGNIASIYILNFKHYKVCSIQYCSFFVGLLFG